MLQVTLTDKDGKSATHIIHFIPASNVLYEEGFMQAANTNASYVDWTKSGTAGDSKQSSKNEAPYGYDAAYAGSTGASGSQYVVTLNQTNRFADNLTFTFTGTGFDLIGACGPNTGTLMASVFDSDGKYVVGYLVDTSFNDKNVADQLYQVPIVHAEGLDLGTYTVKISGAYIVYNNAASAASTYALDSVCMAGENPVDTIYELFFAMGLTEDEIDQVHFLNMDALYGAGTVAEDGTNTAAAAPEKMTLEIDGFRVYTTSSNDAYADGEKNVEYWNVLDAANDGFTGYVEGSTGNYTNSNYEAAGGPQNEIYLPAGQAVVFQTGLEKGTVVQISARAVTGQTALNTADNVIRSNTEMYYQVTVGDQGVITIKNAGSGMLALGNLKLPAAAASLMALTEESYAVAYAMLDAYAVTETEPEPPVDEPEPEPELPAYDPFVYVDVRSINLFRSKVVTMTITTSTDVETLTVNGKTLRPTNSRLVKYGLSDHYVYVYVDTVRRGETVNYEITATNSDGLSCTCGAQG